MNELSGKTIGIIGFGSIGQKVARIALAFNMNVIAYSRNINKVKDIIVEEFQDKRNISYGSINDICLKSDIITLHCPLNSESERMINKDFLNNCKKTCFLVNTARGGLIDENALLNALNNEVIEGAGIDVLTEEPMLFNCSLVGAKNITITPHIAWAPLETRQRLLEIVINNLRKYLEGKPINVVH